MSPVIRRRRSPLSTQESALSQLLREPTIDASSPAGSALVAADPATARMRRCETMLAHPTAAIAIVAAGRVVDVNARWRTLFAMPMDAALAGFTTAGLFASVQVAERFERAAAFRLREAHDHEGHGVHATFEHPLVRVDGRGFLGEILIWSLASTGTIDAAGGDAIWEVCDVTAERALHAELRDLDGYYRALQEHQRDLSFVVDRKGRIAYVSPSVEAVLGYRDASLLGRAFTMLLEPGQRSETERWFRQRAMRRPGEEQRVVEEDYLLHIVASDGTRHTLACHPHDCFDVPRLSGLVLHARDVTADLDVASRRALADAVHERLRQRLATFAAAPPDVDRIVAVLEGACSDLLVDRAVWSTSSGEAAPRVVRAFAVGEAVEQADKSVGDAVALVHALDRRGQTARAVDDIDVDPSTRDHRTAFGTCAVAAFVDVTMRIDPEIRGFLTIWASAPRGWTAAEIDYVSALGPLLAQAGAAPGPGAISSYDPLTSLIGRAEARQRLTTLLADRASHPALLVLVANLDRMRAINDRHGHEVGDRIIAEAARRLVAMVRDAGFVARIGGDEFMAVFEEADVAKSDASMESALEILAAVAPDGHTPRFAASIGAARMSIDSPDAESLWHKADCAMREAKARGRGQAVLFHPRLAAVIAARTSLGAEIEDGLERDEFTLFYQPQISLSSGKVVGLEALLRWQHPTRGLLLPHVFIEAAIEGGLIDTVTKVVFGQVCDQIVRWQRMGGFPEVPVSVNVSAQQLHDRRLPALVASALLRTALPARLLILELTEEHLVVDSAATERVVKELALLGVRIAIGSFGLNHASLRLLHQLQVAQIKLDRGFVERLPHDREAALVVDAAIEIARRLKCQVIAEGVETQAQFECLRDMRCEAGQGFYFGAPLSAAELQSFVETSPVHAATR